MCWNEERQTGCHRGVLLLPGKRFLSGNTSKSDHSSAEGWVLPSKDEIMKTKNHCAVLRKHNKTILQNVSIL